MAKATSAAAPTPPFARRGHLFCHSSSAKLHRGELHLSWAILLTSPSEPPESVALTLEETLELLAALEDARDALAETDHLAVLAQVEHEVRVLSRKLGFDEGSSDVR